MSDVLTIEAARAYVEAYHAECGDTVMFDRIDERELDGQPSIRLDVRIIDLRGHAYDLRWDVWLESGSLYGEC